MWKGNIKRKQGYFLITLYFNISFCNEFLIKVVDGTWVISIVYKKYQTTFQINITWFNNISLSRIRYCVVISCSMASHTQQSIYEHASLTITIEFYIIYFSWIINLRWYFSAIFILKTCIYYTVPFLSRMNYLAYRWL